jgi:tetratricopeptide (TPR) repeat protein
MKHAPNRGTAQIASDKRDGEYFRAQRALEKLSSTAGGAKRELGQLWIGQFMQIPWAPRQPDLLDDGSLGPILGALVSGGGLVVKEGSVATGGDYVGQYGDVRFEAVAYAKHRYLVTIRAWKGSPEEQNWRSLVTRLGYFDFFLDTVRAGGGASASAVAVVKQKFQAALAIRQGKLAEAAEAIQAALASAPDDPQALSLRGMLSASAGQFDTALKAYKAVLDRWPDYAVAHYGVGAIYMLQRRYQDAVMALSTAVALKPTMWDGYLLLASAYCHLVKRTEASGALAQAGEADPDMGIPDQLKP